MLTRLAALIAVLLSTPAAAASADPPPAPTAWESALAADHPLAGTLWNLREGRRAEPAELAAAAADAQFVLLGETHDNPDHHRIQAWAVRAMAAQARRPAVVFEMIGADQADALRRYLESHPEDPGGLGPAVRWTERGWPDWAMYRPVAAAALAAGLPIRAGDVSGSLRRQVGGQGLQTLPKAERRRLGLDAPLSAPLAKTLRAELKSGHCDLLPESALGPMAAVQWLRDAAMADSLISAAQAGGDGAVLIAGRGHVRADRGVPWYLRSRLDDPSVLTLAIFEVADGVTDWRGYLPDTPESAARPFDFAWLTPRADDTDHCAELRKRLESN